MQPEFIKYHKIKGTVLIIGYGSIGRGILPLIQRHFDYDRLVIIDPFSEPEDKSIKVEKVGLTKENYKEELDKIFEGGKGFLVNLSVNTSSRDVMTYCQTNKILYIDTVVEEWEGFYDDESIPLTRRSNYALRERLIKTMRANPSDSTVISCCGANPGMVNWMVKQAMLNIAKDTNYNLEKEPKTREQWTKLMRGLGIKGIHIAERDLQRTDKIRPVKEFWNTWSVLGFISQGVHQVAELGYGTHQKWTPRSAREFNFGSKCSIYLAQPGVFTRVKTWCPTYGPQLGLLVTHNQSISITDYYTIKQDDKVVYRPTCHYAYHPIDEAISSAYECLGSGDLPEKWKILGQDEITDGIDELGVLLYGHAKNAYWYGSQLSIHDTKKLIKTQNATGLQVSSAVIAGMVWALENPNEGLVECDQMDFKRCLQIQHPYIAPVNGFYTDWNPLKNQLNDFTEDAFDESDPWQFKNILMDGK